MQPFADIEQSIEYSEDQAMLARTAGELLSQQWDFAAVRRWMGDERGYDPALYRRMAELGWLGVAVPEAYGGAGMGVGALVSLAEPMGRYLFASPWLASTLAAQVLSVAGSAAQKRDWLPRLVAGEALGSVALTEPSGDYGLERMQVEATAMADGYRLKGSKTFVLDAQSADFVLVAACLDSGPTWFLVTRDALEGRMRREQLVDETRRSVRLDLNDLQLPTAARLDGGEDEAALQHVQRVSWLLLAAEAAGGAEGVMQLTLDYLKTRKQFGKLIGGYQGLKHPMVEIMCAIEQGRSLLYHAATAFDRAADPQTLETALRMAKAQLSDTYAHAADRAIQFHGAIGFTYECHAQLFLRRALWAQHSFGDGDHHRRRLASLLL